MSGMILLGIAYYVELIGWPIVATMGIVWAYRKYKSCGAAQETV